MQDFLIVSLIGVTAGVADCLPMLRKPIPAHSIWALFLQWVLITWAIAYLNCDWSVPIKGAVVGVSGLMPLVVITHLRNRKAVPRMVVSAALLGIGIAYAIAFCRAGVASS
jgi:phosphate starvation-inducible membrane PsiE